MDTIDAIKFIRLLDADGRTLDTLVAEDAVHSGRKGRVGAKRSGAPVTVYAFVGIDEGEREIARRQFETPVWFIPGDSFEFGFYS